MRQEHVDSVLASGIDPQLAEIAGFRSIDEDVPLGPGLFIPYLDPTTCEFNGFARVRLDNPRPKGPKYLQPPKTGSRLYFAPLLALENKETFKNALESPLVPLIIVEGEKKALALQQRVKDRMLVVGVGGSYNWVGKNHIDGAKTLLEDFSHIELKGRRVYIAYDSDVVSNPQVMQAERGLARALKQAGAKQVKLLTLMPSGDEKVGLDDALLSWGDNWEAELKSLINEAIEERIEIPEVFSYSQMLDTEFKPIRVIIGKPTMPILNSSGLCYVHSMSGIGKTYFCLQMAHSLAVGSKFVNFQTERPLRVLFLQAELSPGWFQRRIRSLNEVFGRAESLWVLNGQMTLARPAEYGQYEINVAPLEYLIKSYNAEVVFIDPLQGFYELAENHTDSNREFQKALAKIRQKYECAIVVTHHDRKSAEGDAMYRMRGSSVLTDWADTVLSLQREEENQNNVILSFDKTRHAEGPRPDKVRLNRVNYESGQPSPWLLYSPNQEFAE